MSRLVGRQELSLALGQRGKQGCRGTLSSTCGVFSVLSWRAWFFLKYLSISWLQGRQAAGLCHLQMPREGTGCPPRRMCSVALIAQKLGCDALGEFTAQENVSCGAFLRGCPWDQHRCKDGEGSTVGQRRGQTMTQLQPQLPPTPWGALEPEWPHRVVPN